MVQNNDQSHSPIVNTENDKSQEQVRTSVVDSQNNNVTKDNPNLKQSNDMKNDNNKNEKSVSSKNFNEQNSMDFDDLLPYVGEFGIYQKILFILMIPFAFFVAWVYFTQIFITLVPENYWCNIPELENLTVEQRLALAIPPAGKYDNPGAIGYSQCSMYNINFTKILINSNTIPVANSSWPIQKCLYGWEYNLTETPYQSISTELNWVCDDAALPAIAQSIFFIGAIFGGLLFGWIADRYGRIPALVGSNLMGFIAGVTTAFAQNYWQFVVCRFFLGFAFDNCFTMMYILVLEYVGPKWRTFVANMSIALFFTFAACILPWIAYYLGDWKMTTIAVSTPLILSLATPWLVPESARWLVSQGHVDRAIDILKKFERINKTHVPDSIYKDFKDSCNQERESEQQNKSYSVIHLFKYSRLRKIVIILIVIWMIISLVFDGHVRNVDNLGLNIFITFTIASATELPADTLLTLLLDRWGRRWLAFSSMTISGIFSLWACVVSNNIYAATLAIIGRFFINISYNIGLQYAAELIPTVVRAQGMSLIHIMGYISSIISPFIVYLAVVSPILPLLLLGIFAVVGGSLALFLPETLDQELPQTLQDGEDFGKNQRIWDVPCLAVKDTDEKKDSDFMKIQRSQSIRSSGRPSTRGEVLRSSMIQRASIRSRRNSFKTPAIQTVRL
ncbi:organic cation transporter protein-like [Chelonus insularis]|uniref:organic cation transporter protein-like n=1 Tax=Chelonus insularis TaxID=460826 RepID=UPI001589F9B5|nr:organic cation transporter protein-like [Chelonus insularis]